MKSIYPHSILSLCAIIAMVFMMQGCGSDTDLEKPRFFKLPEAWLQSKAYEIEYLKLNDSGNSDKYVILAPEDSAQADFIRATHATTNQKIEYTYYKKTRTLMETRKFKVTKGVPNLYGDYESCYPSGNRHIIATYHGDLLEGTYTEYYDTPKRQKKIYCTYTKGENFQHRYDEYYENGQIKYKRIPDKSNNNIMEANSYYKNGNLKAKARYIKNSQKKTGQYVEYYPDGKTEKLHVEEFEDGKLTGQETYFTEAGKRVKKKDYHKNTLTGITCYDENTGDEIPCENDETAIELLLVLDYYIQNIIEYKTKTRNKEYLKKIQKLQKNLERQTLNTSIVTILKAMESAIKLLEQNQYEDEQLQQTVADYRQQMLDFIPPQKPENAIYNGYYIINNYIYLSLSMLDENNEQIATNINHNNYEIYLDDKEVQSTQITSNPRLQEQQHLSMILCDVSGSMMRNDPYRKRVGAGESLVDLLSDKDNIILGTFGESENEHKYVNYAQIEKGNAIGKQELKNSIRVSFSKDNGSHTPLYSSVCQGIDKLQEAYNELIPTTDYPISTSMIVLTDGCNAPHQHGHKHNSVQAIMTKSQELLTPVFFVGLTDTKNPNECFDKMFGEFIKIEGMQEVTGDVNELKNIFNTFHKISAEGHTLIRLELPENFNTKISKSNWQIRYQGYSISLR